MGLTTDQQAAFRAQVKAQIGTDSALAAAYSDRQCGTIAAIMSAGRTRVDPTVEIGNGSIVDVLGLDAGNAVLDAIHSQPSYKYVIALLDQGRLRIYAKAAQDAMAALVTAGTLTQAGADALTALAQVDDPLSVQDASDALYNDDGSFK